MTSAQPLCSNFAHLGKHDDQLLRLGLLAERYFPEDPNTSLSSSASSRSSLVR